LRDPDELLELATYEAGCEARSAAYRKAEMEQEISRKMRERILPD
jgi:selenocysteine lyase/cysteine desulfurase